MKRTLLTALLLVTFMPTPALSETTGWMNKKEFNSFARKLRKSDKKPVKIKCKIGDSYGNIHIKVTTAPNRNNARWGMGIYKGPKLYAGNMTSIDYVVNPKSGAITNCYID